MKLFFLLQKRVQKKILKKLLYIQGMTKKFSQSDKKINNYKTIKLTKNVTENCYASYN